LAVNFVSTKCFESGSGCPHCFLLAMLCVLRVLSVAPAVQIFLKWTNVTAPSFLTGSGCPQRGLYYKHGVYIVFSGCGCPHCVLSAVLCVVNVLKVAPAVHIFCCVD